MKLLQPLELFQQCLKTNGTKQGRLLGLDVGVKSVGLAVSDPHNRTAAPICVLERKKTNIDFMAKDFQQLVSELSLVGFVVGCPFGEQSLPIAETLQVKLFMADICQTGKLEGLSYTYWDEYYKWWKCVGALLKPLKMQPVPYKTLFNKLAAAGILQNYLDHVKQDLEVRNTGGRHV